MHMSRVHISFMQRSDIEEATKVLSIAMLNNPLHIAVFQGNGESERLKIETMFVELFHTRPGIVFLARQDWKVIGVMRMNSCAGKKDQDETPMFSDENDFNFRKSFWLREWAIRDPLEQHWHLGPIGVLPSYRKMGIGSKLMQRFCQEVDNCSAPAYLETDTDENVTFYQRFGFEIVARSKIFQVDSRYMSRAAQR